MPIPFSGDSDSRRKLWPHDWGEDSRGFFPLSLFKADKMLSSDIVTHRLIPWIIFLPVLQIFLQVPTLTCSDLLSAYRFDKMSIYWADGWSCWENHFQGKLDQFPSVSSQTQSEPDKNSKWSVQIWPSRSFLVKIFSLIHKTECIVKYN